MDQPNSMSEKKIPSEIGFRPEYFSDLASAEAGNFWFMGRNKLISSMLKKYCGQFDSFLEVGCGTGFVLSAISKLFPSCKITGTELFKESFQFSKQRVPNAQFMQMDAREIPYKNEFDVIGMFDVLEHIEEDELVLTQTYSALNDNGYLIMTVPQHKWLWSQADEYACHVRRYTAKEINEKLSNAGFSITRSTSFVFILLPAMALSRLSKKDKEYDPLSEFQIPKLINSTFYILLKIEIFLIKLGINLPMGGSRLVVAQKTSSK